MGLKGLMGFIVDGPQNGLDLHCVPLWNVLPIFNEIH